jgi:methylthioribulose-1-phosphate dehydratase
MLGTAGNLSARHDDGSFWITASGRPKHELTEDDFVRVSMEGEVLEGGRSPSAETVLHRTVYLRHPEARACFHVHSPEDNLVSTWHGAELPLPPLEMLKGLGIPDEEPRVSLAVLRNHRDVDEIARELSERFERPFQVPGFLIRRHGITTWADSLEQTRNHVELFEFIFRYLVLERQTS